MGSATVVDSLIIRWARGNINVYTNVNADQILTRSEVARPDLVSPADASVAQSVNPTLSWSAVSGATNYRLQVATDAAFASVVHDNANILGTSVTISSITLNSLTTYYWRVQTKTAGTASSYSQVRSFTTAHFAEVATAAGVNDAGTGEGVAWGDYDSDGDQDLYVVNYGSANRLYRNNGNGAFSEVGASAGVDDSGNGDGAAWGDYDNDGDLDLYLANNGANRLYRNNGNGSFAEVGSSAGVADAGYGQGVAWADYDWDSDLDLYVVNYGSATRLYRNNNNGTFTEVGAAAGVADTGSGYNPAWGDYDNDGDPDLYVTNNGVNRLYRNNNDGTFSEVGAAAGVAAAGYGTGATWGDYDNDGDLDLYAVDHGNANRLYRNNGNGAFSEVGSSAGVDAAGAGYGVAWGDYDNDGDLDLYVANYGSANRLYRNNNNGTFTEIGVGAGVADAGNGVGVAWADYDGDGDLDLYLVNQGANLLYRNNGNTNRWLQVKLNGTNSNKSGIGAKVSATANGITQRREVEGGGGFLSQSSLPVAFGFGGTTTVNQLTLTWPSGVVQTLSNVATNQVLTLSDAITPTQLVFTTQPGGAVHGQSLGVQPVVEARDASGQKALGYAGTVTLAAGSGGTLSGSLTAVAVDGVASFSGAVFSGAGTRTLIASAAGLSSATSAPIAVAKAPASITFISLTAAFNGQPQVVGVTTNPPGLPVGVGYNGSGSPPVAPGVYAAVATIADPNYAGSASANFTIFAPPVAKLNASVIQGNPPLEVNFTDGSSGAIDAWYLETFDSGGRTSENRGGGIKAVYDRPGTYEAVLTVRGPGGQSTSRVGITVFRSPQVGAINAPSALEDAVLELNLAGLDPEPGGWSVRGVDAALVAKAEVQGDRLRFTPVPDASGTNAVEIVRTGLSGLVMVQQVALKWLAQDDPPRILPTLPSAYQGAEDQPLQIGGAGFAQDVDTDPGTLVWSASGYDTRLVASATGGSGGVTLVPVPDANGQTKALLKLRDPATGTEISSEVTLNWTPVPDPPQTPKALVPANGASGVSLSPVLAWAAKDVDGEALRYTLTLGAAGQSPATLGTDLGTAEFSVPLLRPSTSYTWKVVARDPTGSSAEASFSFTTQADRQPPTLSSLRVAPSEESAALSWNTSELARGTVRVMPEAGGETLGLSGETLTDQHHLVVRGLKSASWYSFEANATDEAGNVSAALRGRFLTLAAPDLQPPRILVAPFVEGLTDHSAVVRWTSDELSTSVVGYSSPGAAGGQQAVSELVKDHQVRLDNLQASITYSYEVQSADAAGNLSAARSGSFTTAAAPDLSPPRFVEGPGVPNVSDKEALVALKADELSTAELRYDTDPDLRDGRLGTSRSGTAHQFQLSGLAPGTQYYYQVLIADGTGNQTVSSQRSFQTRSTPDLRPAQILEGPAVEGLSEAGGVLVLRADEPVTLQVLLSAQADLGAPALLESSQLQQRHSLTFGNLLADTPYFYQVTATDAAGNATSAMRGQFRTARQRDVLPPRFVEGPFVEGTNAESASLAWRTDELATGTMRVEEESGVEASRELALSTPSREQRVQLTQLSPDTRYTAAVSVQDAQGNPSTARVGFKTRKVADLLPPRLLSGPSVQGLSAAGAAIALSCDEPTEVVLRYGIDPGLQGAEVVSTGERRREHWIELRGLSAGATYHGSVVASDAAGNTAQARSFSFTTPAQQDLVLPVFTAGPAALAVTQEGARIEWGLDEPASGVIELAAGESLAGAAQIGVMERRQRQGVEVTGLSPNTTYAYRVHVMDAAGNEGQSSVRTFKTLGLQVLSPPVFTAGPAVPQVSQDQATVFWRTDQPADAQIEYFQNSDPGEVLSESRGRLENEHSVVLTNLAAGVEYTYRASSRNAQGTGGEARSGTFRTRAVKDEKPPVLLGSPSVLSLQQDRARISWRTDELADSQVRFGDQQGGGGQADDPGATVDHILDLTNLKPGTTYHYQVASTDQAGNGPTLSGEQTFTTPLEADQTPPQFTRWPTIKTRTANALLLSWATSELSTATLAYGKTPQYELGNLNQLEPSAEHEWHLGQLEPGQTYHLRIGAVDLVGNGPAFAPPLEVATLVGADLVPPAILTGPIVVQSAATSAVIEWSTDEATDGEVNFSGAGLSDAAVDPEFSRSHQLVLTNLSPGQVYEYTVASRDVAGNGPTRSGAGQFTTRAAGQTPAPQITGGPTALEVGPNGATFVWHTDVPANTALDYGLTITYGQQVSRGELTQEHTVSLVGLTPGTAYHFKASSVAVDGGLVSTDPAGNTLYSLDHQFTTPQSLDQEVPQLIRAPVVEWTDRTAVVNWTTDELSGSRVDWAWIDSKGQAQADFVADNELVRDHNLTLTQLKKRSSYRFQVTSVDGAGNAMIWGTLVEAAKAAPGNRAAKILQPPGGAGAFVTDNLPDTQPPVIIDGPRIREKTTQSLTVEWETDELSDSFVRFGSSDKLGEELGQARDEVVHQITLTNLTPGQKYYFKVASTDPSGNGATESGVALSTTAAEVDLSPPRFLDEPKVLSAADDEAVIAWRTDEAASARVEYWVQGSEVLTRRTLERLADQRLALTNLKPDTDYLARVFVTDASQNEARAGVDLRLHTDRLPDLSPPQLLGEPVVSQLSDRGATIEWTTDELANSSVDYDLTPYLGAVTGNPEYATRHRVMLTGLQPGEIYYFKVGSADLSGNGPVHSEVSSLTTLSAADSEAPEAPKGLQVRSGTRALLVSWQAGGERDLAGYTLYRAEEDEFALIASALAGTSYLDEGLIEGRTYSYQLKAQDRQGNLGAASDIASGVPILEAQAPKVLGLEQGTAPGLPVLLIQAPDQAEPGLSYTAQVSSRADFGDVVDRGGNLQEGVGGLTRWRVGRTLDPAQGYWWRARAFDGFFEGSWSAPVQLVPAEAEKPTLTEDFDGDGNVGFGDFFLFADGFGGNDPTLDLDADGVVGFGDFFLFADHFGQSIANKPRWAQQAQVAEGTALMVEAKALSPVEVVLTLHLAGVEQVTGYGLILEFDPPVLHYVASDSVVGPGGNLRLVRQLDDQLLLAEHLGGRQQGVPPTQLLGGPLHFRVEHGRLPALRVRVSAGAISTGRGRGWRVAQNGQARIVPQGYALLPNYPNPFNPATTLNFALPVGGEGRLEICNLLGQTLRHWELGQLGPGYHAQVWDGLDQEGRPTASGVYLARLRAGSFSQTHKLLLLR